MGRKEVYLDDCMRGWIANTARAEQWRMAPWYDEEALKQDGYLCYAKCIKAYPELAKIENPTQGQRKHFMSLVQTTFRNHIMTLAGKFAVGKEEAMAMTAESDADRNGRLGVLEDFMPPVPEEASVIFALKNAPKELRDAVDILLRDGIDGHEYLRTQLYMDGTRLRRMRRSCRETTAQYFERLTGVSDLPNKLRDFLFS